MVTHDATCEDVGDNNVDHYGLIERRIQGEISRLARLAAEKQFARRTGSRLGYRDQRDRQYLFNTILAEEVAKRQPEQERRIRKAVAHDIRGV